MLSIWVCNNSAVLIQKLLVLWSSQHAGQADRKERAGKIIMWCVVVNMMISPTRLIKHVKLMVTHYEQNKLSLWICQNVLIINFTFTTSTFTFYSYTISFLRAFSEIYDNQTIILIHEPYINNILYTYDYSLVHSKRIINKSITNSPSDTPKLYSQI